MTIFDLITAKEIASFYTNSPYNKMPYLGETMFPAKKQLGLDLKWIKGSMGLPVALVPSNFDAKATMRDRVGFSDVETEMPFFREGARVGEKDRQEINKLLQSNNSQQFLNPILANIFDDKAKLVEGSRVQAERMRMQLLSTGKIAIAANRINYDYDFGFPATHQTTLLTDARWSVVAKATPVTDIQTAMDLVEEDTGIRPTDAICSRKTFNYLLSNQQIRGDLLSNSVNGSGVIVTDDMIKKYLFDKLGLRVAVYTKKYSDGASAQQYFPDDVFSLVPPGDLGSTWYGTTPEESDLMAGNTEAQVQIVQTGVAITTFKEPHPVNIVTIVSAIVLPSFEQIDSCYIINVNG